MLVKAPLVVVVILSLPRIAVAECIVGPPGFFAEHAAVVFSGTARKVATVEASDVARARAARLVEFEVERSWKGPFRGQLNLYVFTRSIEGFRVDVGKKYLVFGHAATEEERLDLDIRQAEAFVIGQCGNGTSEFATVSSGELLELGPGVSPRR